MRKLITIASVLLASACSEDSDLAQDAGPSHEPDAAIVEDGSVEDGSVDDAAGDGDGDDGGGITVCPEKLSLEGEAEAMNDDGARVECIFFGTIEMNSCKPNGDIDGVFLGEIIRRTEQGDAGIEFAPLVGGPASLTVTSGDSVELRFVGEQPDDALRFWLELEVIEGTRAPGHHYSGTWRCAPGLLDEPSFMDVDLTAEGSWTLEPESP